jgi:hypothetical protein
LLKAKYVHGHGQHQYQHLTNGKLLSNRVYRIAGVGKNERN